MWRYFAIATAIVVVVGAIIAWIPSAPRPERKSTYSSVAHASPGPPEHDRATQTADPISGDAPWALSALPECFREDRHARGTLAYVRSKVPHDAVALAPGTTLRVANCTVAIGRARALVTRGDTRLRIEPSPHFWRARGRLVLEVDDGARGDLRVYTPQAALSVVPPARAPATTR